MWVSLLLLRCLCAALALHRGCHGAAATVRTDVELHLSELLVEPLLANETLALTVSAIPSSISFVTVQAHTRDLNLTAGFTAAFERGDSYDSTDAGLLFPLQPRDSRLQWFLHADTWSNATASLLALAYTASDPVPGGCNLEYDMEVDPNLHLSYNLYETVLEFAPANLGYPRGSIPPACDRSQGPKTRWRLEYDLYQIFLGEGDLGFESLFAALNRLSSASGCEAYGTKMQTLSSTERPRLVQTSYPGVGVVFGVVARDPARNSSAAYVPAATYACSFMARSDGCLHLGKLYYKILIMFSGLLGLFMCFFGHRFFKTQVFLDGFLVACFVAYVVVTRATLHASTHTDARPVAELSDDARVAIACSVGVVAGLALVGLWWRFAFSTACVLTTGGLLGFLVTSAAFFSPLSDLEIFDSDVNFWLCFSCVALLVPILLLLFPCLLSVMACAVLGGYAVVLAGALFVRSSLPYLLLNSVRRAALRDYRHVYNAAPFQTNDFILATVWGVLALAGTVVQTHRERGRPLYPPDPYEEWLYRSERRATNILDPSHHRPGARRRAAAALAAALAALRRPAKRRWERRRRGGGEESEESAGAASSSSSGDEAGGAVGGAVGDEGGAVGGAVGGAAAAVGGAAAGVAGAGERTLLLGNK